MKPAVIIPVIMCGGSGKRLWPLSRENHPKQFLRLDLQKSILQQTINRFSNQDLFRRPIILSNYQYRFHCAEQLSECGFKEIDILLEHHSRNTAPALAAASHHVQKNFADECLILAIPADHHFTNDNKIEQMFASAIQTAQDGKIVTFGITPTYPETGYGYIQYDPGAESPTNKIHKFHEKPDHETAEGFVKAGNYLWNSGIFLFSPKVYLEEINKFHPEIAALTAQSVTNSEMDLGFISLEREAYGQCENISVDYAVMEKTDKGHVCKWDAEWKDIGSWQALYELFEKDEDNNVRQGNVITQNTTNSFIRSDKKLTAVIGLDDLIVVDTHDALLITKKSALHDIKALVEFIKDNGHQEYNNTISEYRPWGHYEIIQNSENYKIKKIHVHPGKKLSLQQHAFRAEHWVILSGEAKITCNEVVSILNRDQSTYIPNQSPHRIENIGEDTLVFIEVQTGSTLSEDDIVRFEDDYGRLEEKAPAFS